MSLGLAGGALLHSENATAGLEIIQTPAVDTVPEVRDLMARALKESPSVDVVHVRDSGSDSPVHIIGIFDRALCEQIPGFNGAFLVNPAAFIREGMDISPEERERISFIDISYGRICPGEPVGYEDPQSHPGRRVTAATQPQTYVELNGGWFTLHERLKKEEQEKPQEEKPKGSKGNNPEEK